MFCCASDSSHPNGNKVSPDKYSGCLLWGCGKSRVGRFLWLAMLVIVFMFEVFQPGIVTAA